MLAAEGGEVGGRGVETGVVEGYEVEIALFLDGEGGADGVGCLDWRARGCE